jgi:hypothetical protein
LQSSISRCLLSRNSRFSNLPKNLGKSFEIIQEIQILCSHKGFFLPFREKLLDCPTSHGWVSNVDYPTSLIWGKSYIIIGSKI